MRPVIGRLAASETRPWARNTAGIAMLVPIWLVVIDRDLLFTTIPTALTIAVCVALRTVPGAVHAARFHPPAGAIVTGLTSIDHGMYILITLFSATTRLRRGWRFAGLGLLFMFLCDGPGFFQRRPSYC